jgi:hypothetical protein
MDIDPPYFSLDSTFKKIKVLRRFVRNRWGVKSMCPSGHFELYLVKISEVTYTAVLVM